MPKTINTSRGTRVKKHENSAPEQTPNGGLTYRFLKRTFDIVSSLAGLVVLSPLFLAVSVAIYVDDSGPALFFQNRLGRNGRIFKMVKFRSMAVDAEKRLERLTPLQKDEFNAAFKLKHDPRVTRVGRFIRRASIDELPQLWNVLKGDMSLVGNRPPLLAEREAYGDHLSKVLSARPGITGYWQVHGRSDIDFSQRIQMAEYYIDHQSLAMDAQVLLATVKVVLGRKGAL